MKKIRAAIVGYGNIGEEIREAGMTVVFSDAFRGAIRCAFVPKGTNNSNKKQNVIRFFFIVKQN